MKKNKKYFAWVLIFVLGSVLIPCECLHDLIHVEQSCHVQCNNPESPQVGEVHKHCNIIDFSVTAQQYNFIDFRFDYTYHQSITLFRFFSDATLDSFDLTELRGPPLA